MENLLIPPENAVISPSGPIWLNADGIIVTITTVPYQTLENAKENMEYNRRMAGGKPRPLLVDMTRVRSLSKEAREEYVRESEEPFITAVALVTKSGVSNMIANFFIRVNPSSIPTKLFTDPEKAREWLLQYLVI